MTSRRPARCAACSRGFRTGEKISVEDASVYHRSCLKWQMENGRLSLVPINPLVDELRARVADLEGQLARAQEWHQREKRLQEGRDADRRATTETALLEVRARNSELRAEVLRLREAAVAARQAEQRDVNELIRAARLGLGIGQGIWGLARYYAAKLGPADDTAARFQLLELS